MILRISYYKLTSKNLPIYGVKIKNLKEYTTSKSDLKKGIIKIPNEIYRIDQILEYDVQIENSFSLGDSP